MTRNTEHQSIIINFTNITAINCTHHNISKARTTKNAKIVFYINKGFTTAIKIMLCSMDGKVACGSNKLKQVVQVINITMIEEKFTLALVC